MTDAPDPLPTEHGAPTPRPGSLEHLAREAPGAPAVVDARTGQVLTRARHDDLAGALAAGLRAEHGVEAGTRVALTLPSGPDLLALLFALAKLGAAPLLLASDLTPGHARTLAGIAGCTLLVMPGLPYRTDLVAGPTLLSAVALLPLAARHVADVRRLSGDQHPADAVQATDGPRPPRLVLRGRAPERLALLAPAVGDLLARVDLPRGGVHLLAGGGHRAEPQFWAGVALITGGAVVTLPDDTGGGEALLAALQDHAVTSVVVDDAQLRSLLALPRSLTDAADLTALRRVIVCGSGRLDPESVIAAADLLGDDVLHAVYATAQTGPVAHADAAALQTDPTSAGTPPTGVSVTVDAGGGLLVRSPLTADGALGEGVARGDWPAPPAWRDATVPTGDRGRLTDDGRVQVTPTAHPDGSRAAR